MVETKMVESISIKYRHARCGHGSDNVSQSETWKCLSEGDIKLQVDQRVLFNGYGTLTCMKNLHIHALKNPLGIEIQAASLLPACSVIFNKYKQLAKKILSIAPPQLLLHYPMLKLRVSVPLVPHIKN